MGSLQLPSIILLAFCLAAPDNDGAPVTVLRSVEQSWRETGTGRQQKTRAVEERERDKPSILTFCCGISPREETLQQSP